MPRISPDRFALVANGGLVFGFSLATFLFDAAFAWGIVLMGCSLIYSGSSGFCGFAVIVAKLESLRGESKTP
ncbi:hypothetical protein [Novipirellula rosea]|uniref:hypothetical protein n=1 Tax=Novipirellula rosea TaxID=1031540 RepID=UPI0030EC0D22